MPKLTGKKRDVFCTYLLLEAIKDSKDKETGKVIDFIDLIEREPDPEALKEAETYLRDTLGKDKKKDLGDMITEAVKHIAPANKKLADEIIDAPDSERVKKIAETQKMIMEFVKDTGVGATYSNLLRYNIFTSEREFELGYLTEKQRVKDWKNAYGDYQKEEVAELLRQEGFAGAAVTRDISTFSNAYFYKIYKEGHYDSNRGFDMEFGKNCGVEYLQFVRENTVFKPEDTKKKNNILLDDKEQLKKNAKAQGEFYRSWSEYITTEIKLGDYFDEETIDKNANKIDFLYSMIIECSQNSQTIRSIDECKEAFMEGHGGREYYDKLTNAIGGIQAVSKAASMVKNKTEKIYNRVVSKVYLDIIKKEGGSIEGKTALDLDPKIYSNFRLEYFTSLFTNKIQDLSTDELEDILKGKMSDKLKEEANRAWEETSPHVPENLDAERKEIADRLDVDLMKKEPGDISTGFEGNYKGVQISEQLREAILKDGSETIPIYKDAYADYLKKNPEKEVKGFDYRDIAECINILSKDEWFPEEKKNFAERFCEDFCDETKRDKLLNKVFSKLDHFSTANYDLSCLHQGMDKGVRGSDNLTPSERDFIKMERIVRAEQALRHTSEYFRDYMGKRYSSLAEFSQFTGKLNNLQALGEPIGDVLLSNGIESKEKSPIAPKIFETEDRLNEYGAGLANHACTARIKIAQGKDARDFDTVMRIDIPKGEDDFETQGINRRLLSDLEISSKSNAVGRAVNEAFGKKAYGFMYIDGMPANDFLEPLFEDIKTNDGVKKETINDETVSKYVNLKEHKIDIVQFGLDSKGNVVPFVQSLQFPNSPEEPLKADPEREERVARVRANINERLGKNKNFSNFMSAEDLSVNKDTYDKFKKENPALERAETLEEKGKRLGKELKSIDRWYHVNSAEFTDVLNALKNPENQAGIVEACNKYINKYFNEEKSFKRSTELGNARMSKIIEIKGLFRDEKSKQDLAGIKKAEERTEKLNNGTIVKTSFEIEQKEYNTEIGKIEKTQEKSKTSEKKLNLELDKGGIH